ncbi:2-hydroxyacid dehydrogenase [Martelella endophytica]|uniref:Hydroxyacid dehydrogenase n=1 Tax=Martelella endophytica TaxID=1486262 RepID=A0A0D5LL97_MAREN|nr:2-hydroxyacid dehydrogenase [Martelella endophytica]AJY44542.1 hydroxyacid dehydrogenase [Martelella endophytica]
MSIDVLSVAPLPPKLDRQMEEAYSYHRYEDVVARGEFEALIPRIRAIAANGESTVTAEFIAKFPNLEILSVFGVGYDGVDAAAAHEQGVIVTHTPGVLTDDVSDHAIGLMLSVARRTPVADRFVREGKWVDGGFPFTKKVSGSRLGIVGLGRIGTAIAKRAEAFSMEIAYTDRAPINGISYAFHETPAALAANVDFLVATTYGGPSTRGLISAEVLAALGPEGYLINVARGTVVDEAALIAALQNGTIAGAGLDVFEEEPHVPDALKALDNAVLTPHMASATHETRKAMSDLFAENLAAHFSGRPIPAKVPQ